MVVVGRALAILACNTCTHSCTHARKLRANCLGHIAAWRHHRHLVAATCAVQLRAHVPDCFALDNTSYRQVQSVGPYATQLAASRAYQQLLEARYEGRLAENHSVIFSRTQVNTSAVACSPPALSFPRFLIASLPRFLSLALSLSLSLFLSTSLSTSSSLSFPCNVHARHRPSFGDARCSRSGM